VGQRMEDLIDASFILTSDQASFGAAIDLRPIIRNAIQGSGGKPGAVAIQQRIWQCWFQIDPTALSELERLIMCDLEPLGYQLQARFDPALTLVVVSARAVSRSAGNDRAFSRNDRRSTHDPASEPHHNRLRGTAR
jgi:hypothetical protein